MMLSYQKIDNFIVVGQIAHYSGVNFAVMLIILDQINC